MKMCEANELRLNSQLSRQSFLLLVLFVLQLLINHGYAGQPPKISEHPVDSVVPRNEPATLNCKAEGDPSPNIIWTKDGRPLTQISDSRQLRFPLPSGSLFFLRVRSQDAGIYACRAVNSFGQVTSRDATLEVATLQEEFRASPQSGWVAQGESTVFDCEPPRGNPEPKVFWKKNGQIIDLKGTGRFSLIGTGSLKISKVREEDEGNYVCLAKSIVGTRQSNPAHLRVTVRPQLTITPANTTAILGSDVSLVCVARGDPPPEISWEKAQGNLPLKRARFDEERLLISNVSSEDAGLYRCVAENKAGSITADAAITVLTPPVMLISPRDLEIQPNSTAILECTATGEPKPIIFWSKEGSHSIIFQGTTLQNFHVNYQGSLKIVAASPRDEGPWFCAAVSVAGSVMHKIHVKVTDIEDLPPPIVSIGALNASEVIGSKVEMPCRAEGNPQPVITWYKNSKSFHLNHRIFTDGDGTLRINDLTLDDSGMYECVASSRSGKYVWKSFLSVSSSNGESDDFLTTRHGREPPAPMQPRIVRVDSTSVTLAWHPKYFIEGELTPPEPPPHQNSHLAKFNLPGEQNGATGKTNPSHTPIRAARASGFEFEEAEESESDYEEEKGVFEIGVERLREVEYEEEEESNQSGNNLIIQSSPTNSIRNESSPNSNSPASSPQPPITAVQSTSTRSQLTTPLISPKSIRKHKITFNVEYYSAQEDKSEWLLGATVSTETVSLQFLKPNAEYVFFVRSVSESGVVSPPSPLSDPVHTAPFNSRQSDGEGVNKARKQLESYVVVVLKNVYAISSTSVKLEWLIVTSGDLIEGFYIYFRRVANSPEAVETDGEASVSYQMLTVLNTGPPTFQISGLEKYSTYQIFLIPFYKGVDGRPSNYVNVTTVQDVPSAAPEIIGTVPLNSSTLLIRWENLPHQHQNGIILGYQLRIWSGPSLVWNQSTNANTTSLELNNLHTGSSYSLQIAAYTIKGIGVFSSMKKLNFNTDVPRSAKEGSKNIHRNVVVNGEDDNRIHISLNNVLPNENGAGESELNIVQFESDKKGPPTSAVDISDFDLRNFGKGYSDNPDELLTEAWFIALIGSVVFLMLLVFVFALYLRRSQIKKDMDKKASASEDIPDGSMPPHYQHQPLWIDSMKSKEPIKCEKSSDLNEYENGNNYAVVQDRHSPIAYASTTLINGEKHKSSFRKFGEPESSVSLLSAENRGVPINLIVSRSNAFVLTSSAQEGLWCSGASSSTNEELGNSNGKSTSHDPSLQGGRKEIRNGGSLNVLSTFQTPLPSRKQLIVNVSGDGPNTAKSSILRCTEPRLNFHAKMHSPLPLKQNQNFPSMSSRGCNYSHNNIF